MAETPVKLCKREAKSIRDLNLEPCDVVLSRTALNEELIKAIRGDDDDR